MNLGCAHHTTTLRKEQFRSTVVLIWSAFSKTWEGNFLETACWTQREWPEELQIHHIGVDLPGVYGSGLMGIIWMPRTLWW